MAKIITAVGNAQIDTAQSKFGGASGLLDGTGDYLTIPWHTDFDVGSGDFTIDFWFRWNASGGYQWFYSGNQTDNSDYQYLGLGFSNGGTVLDYFASSNNTSWDLLLGDTGALDRGTITVTTGVWHHFALTRSGNNWKGFIDGVLDWSKTQAGTVVAANNRFIIGAHNTLGANFNGWIDEFRFSKGIARWTANFTPPSSAYSTDSNTKLLAHCDGTDGSTTFTDDSGNYSQTLTEIITIADSVLKSTQRLFSEIITIIDPAVLLQKIVDKILTEIVTITDSITRSITRVISEVITITDSFTRSIKRIFSEIITIVDTISNAVVRTLTLLETISITDVTRKLKNGWLAGLWSRQTKSTTSWTNQSKS